MHGQMLGRVVVFATPAASGVLGQGVQDIAVEHLRLVVRFLNPQDHIWLIQASVHELLQVKLLHLFGGEHLQLLFVRNY